MLINNSYIYIYIYCKSIINKNNIIKQLRLIERIFIYA